MQNVLKSLPEDAESRKSMPITSGVLDYFPLAVAEVAKVSKAGNDQHNPGQPLHWNRSKSGDHADCITRHLIQRGTVDSDGMRHTAKLAWRALALLQEELEQEAGFNPTMKGLLDDLSKTTMKFPESARPGGCYMCREGYCPTHNKGIIPETHVARMHRIFQLYAVDGCECTTCIARSVK